MRLSSAARALITDARFSSADVSQLQSAIQSGAASASDAVTIAQRYADTLEGGVGSELQKLLATLGAQGAVEAPIANLSTAPGLLNGLVTLPGAGRNHADVRTVQRGLIALASRTDDAAISLPNWGADGDYGSETKGAVSAFQQKVGLPVTGEVDLATAQALDKELKNTQVPAIFVTDVPTNSGPKIEDMAKAAKRLIRDHAQHYGVDDAWYNYDENHALPARVRLGGLKGKWKCNLFACNTMVVAGFEPPYYGNRGRGEYPNANQLYKWSDKYAGQFGNKGHEKFELRGELHVAGLSSSERAQKIEDLLKTAEPGDMIIVDHVGSDVADGGHCRVVMENDLATGGDLYCAQASRNEGLSRREPTSAFTGEETIWILRPNVARDKPVA